MQNSGGKPQPKLKPFKAIQKNLAMAGISPKLATQSCPLNVKISERFLILGTTLTFSSVYIFNYAETFSEYIQSTYIATAVSVYTFALLALILKAGKFFEFIIHCEDMLNTSKCCI